MGSDHQTSLDVEGKPSHEKTIVLASVTLLFLSLFFLAFSDLITMDLFRLKDLPFIVFMSAIPFMVTTLILSLIYIVTSKWLKIKRCSSGKKILLRIGPFWLAALFCFCCALWNMLPAQRLKWVCWGTVIKASHVQVAGMRGLQISEWLAVFETDPVEFQKLVQEQEMKDNGREKFTEEMNRLVLIKNSKLCRSLSPTAEAPAYYREVISSDGAGHGGIYATYDTNTSRAVVFHTGY